MEERIRAWHSKLPSQLVWMNRLQLSRKGTGDLAFLHSVVRLKRAAEIVSEARSIINWLVLLVGWLQPRVQTQIISMHFSC
ncbi:unnamed protein product [Protopolystoma xenopodis]|uniref:Uncharacterized protein n=1 Tax=Protopolystoma xenopodis TaxID=117903 RepID=A0A3S5BFY6_9PLAT|nr:unnamed protein product [Protopolystoma xenopodis]